MPLEIPEALLYCEFPPTLPEKPEGGDTGKTASIVVVSLYGALKDCNDKVQAIRKLNGR